MTQAGRQPGEDGPPEVGSLAEEAARLMGALSGWAREHDDPAPWVSGAPDAAGEHAAPHGGASECTTCPVCRTVHAVRSLSPEVRGHLAAAGTSLLAAAAGLLATAVPDERSGHADGEQGEQAHGG